MAICLAVSRTTRSSRLLPGHDADYTIKVWLASSAATDASPPDTPAPDSTATSTPPASAAGVAVGFTTGSGGRRPSFTACPAAVTQGTCPVGSLLPGAPPAVLKAELAIPLTATAGQRFTFTVTTATSTAGVLTGSRTRTVVVARAATPSAGPTPAASSPHPSPASSSPRPARTPATTRAAATPAAAAGAGSTLPAGLGTPAPGISPSLGTLPPPSASSSGVTFPTVTPGPSLTPSPVTLTGPVKLGAAGASSQFPLRAPQAGLQAGALGLLAAGMIFAIAKVSLRRTVPGGRTRTAWRWLMRRRRVSATPEPEPPDTG